MLATGSSGKVGGKRVGLGGCWRKQGGGHSHGHWGASGCGCRCLDYLKLGHFKLELTLFQKLILFQWVTSLLITCDNVLCFEISLLSFFLKKKFFFNVYFWDRERQSMNGGGSEREGDTESKTGSRLWAVSTEPDAGLEFTDREIMTWAEVRHLTDQATQAPLLWRI